MPATPSPAVVYTASFGDFVLGGGAVDAGASREWERRIDAPLALRLTLGGPEDGEEAEIAARDLGTHSDADFIPVDDDADGQGDEQGGQAPADGGRRKSAPAALRGEEAQPVAPARRTAMQSSDTPPWWHRQAPRTMSRLRSPLLRLHQEIVDFCRFTEPTAEEGAARVAAVERVRSVVVSIWPGARLEVFGSCATGLYLPTSDVDAVILDSGCSVPGDGLRALALAVTRRGVGQRVALIAKARIPIIKFTEATSGLAFDISFDVANGPAAAAWMRAAMGALPPLRPLTLVLKAFLQQRELNEVYSGGVGSYALVVMLVALLRTHEGEWGPEPNLGALLLAFLDLYGRQLNAEAVGVSASGFFNKAQRGWCDERRPELLAVEDPRDAANDLTRNSFNARAIRIAFEHAHRLLSAPAETRTESLLGRVVHLDTALTGRAQLQSQGPIAAQPSVINQQQQQPGPGEGAATPGESKRQRKKKRAAQAAALAAAQLEEGELPDEDGGEELDAPPRKKGKKARRAAE